MKDQKMRGSSLSRVTMVALLFFSILIIAQIKLSPPYPIFSSSSSSSADITIGLSLSNHSATSTNQPPPSPEKGHGEIKQDPLPSQLSRPPRAAEIKCDRTSERYDLCSINAPTVLDPTTYTFFVVGPKRSANPKIVEKIKPHPRKFDNFLMPNIKIVTLISGPRSPPCKVHHNVPALVFSVGGYTGNFWHVFNDGFVPLFITVNTIFPNHQDFVFVISEGPDWWPTKYADLLNAFTKHPIISLKKESTTHCFPSAHVGLISHGFMNINQTLLPNLKTYLHFRDVLSQAYNNRKKSQAYNNHHNQTLSPRSPIFRPRLVFASRKGSTSRVIQNLRETIRVMEEVGFDVVVFEPNENTPLHESYALINSSHAMIGVHGAALTHLFFLRPGSVFLQIVPIGIEWAAEAFFGRVGKGLKLEYMKYHIEAEESSLAEKYGKDSLMVRNPLALQKGGWPPELMNIYLLEQNVTLNLVRLRGYLEKAYKKAIQFMHKEGGDVSLAA